jgi:hypothetical protein
VGKSIWPRLPFLYNFVSINDISTTFDNNNEVRRRKKWANEDKFIIGRNYQLDRE